MSRTASGQDRHDKRGGIRIPPRAPLYKARGDQDPPHVPPSPSRDWVVLGSACWVTAGVNPAWPPGGV